MESIGHVEPTTLQAYLDGEPLADRAQIEAHLEECEQCELALESLTPRSLFGGQDAQGKDDSSTSPPTDSYHPNAQPTWGRPGQGAARTGRESLSDHYEILGRLGSGGMGVVYQARDIRLGWVVALKLLQSDNPARVARFDTEAHALGRMKGDPNVVQVRAAGECNGQRWIAQEYVEGGTLADSLRERRPTVREAVSLVAILARAMHRVHRRGILHRDLKPANILLTRDGVPKLSDFGLARIQDDEGQTRTGDGLGTLVYLPPEQALDAKSASEAADVYGLGCLLYECLTGKAPFGGKNDAEILNKVLKEQPPSPSELDPSVPSVLSDIVLKCLHKQPEQRYQSAEELANALGGYLSRRWWAASACAVLLVLLAGVSWAAWPRGEQPRVAEALPKTVERWWVLDTASNTPAPREAKLDDPLSVFPGDLTTFASVIPGVVFPKLTDARRKNGLEQRAVRTIASPCFCPPGDLSTLRWGDLNLYVAAVLVQRTPGGALVPVSFADPVLRSELRFVASKGFDPTAAPVPQWLILHIEPLDEPSMKRLDADLAKKSITPFRFEFR